MMFSILYHVVTLTGTSCLLLLNNILLYGYITFVYFFIIWWAFGWFYSLTITNKTIVSIYVWILHWYVFITLGLLPRSEIADLYGNSMCNILRNSQKSFPKRLLFYILISNIWRFHFPTTHQFLLLTFLIPSCIVSWPYPFLLTLAIMSKASASCLSLCLLILPKAFLTK